MKKNTIIAFTFVLLFSTSVASAANYVLGYSAVDKSKKEIRWGGSTTYSSQWGSAITTWNEQKMINVAPDTIWTYQDLTVSDIDNATVKWTGIYTPSAGSDTIKLNKAYLKNNTNVQRQNTATHELGHALGLAHSFFGNVMYESQTSQTALGTQDKKDYTYLWGT